MTARDVIDFPEPDSPTRPSTFPSLMEKARSRTARNPVAGPVTTVAESNALRTAVASVPDPSELGFRGEPGSFLKGNSTFRLRTSSRAGTWLW